MLEGGFFLREGRRTMDVGAGDIVLHAPGETRSNRFGRLPTRTLNVGLDPSLWSARASQRIASPPVRDLLGKLHRELRVSDDLSRLVIEGLTLELAGEIANERWERPRWLSEVRELIDAALPEKPSLDALAAAAGVHSIHLSRAFRRHFGCTVGEYVRRRCIERAWAVLRTSDVPVAAIAASHGFADQSHFTRDFRRLTGLTPEACRRLFRSRQ